MPAEIQILDQLDLFKNLSFEEKEKIAELMNPVGITEGEVLTRRCDPAHTFFIILSGNFMIYFKDEKAFTLHEKGSIIGMSTVMTPFRYRGTTIALTDGEVLSIPGDKFLELIQGDSSLGEKLMPKIHEAISKRKPFARCLEKEKKISENNGA